MTVAELRLIHPSAPPAGHTDRRPTRTFQKTTLPSNHINLHLTVLRRILLRAVLRWGLDWCLTSYMPSGAFPIGKRRWTLQPCHNSRTSSQQDLTTFTPPRAKHHHLESVSNPRHHDRASSLILSTPTSNPNKSTDMAGGGKGTRRLCVALRKASRANRMRRKDRRQDGRKGRCASQNSKVALRQSRSSSK
jgi:hypothetical protein